jgi:hypothetical protein
MKNLEALEKGKLIKDALKIVDELAKNNIADIDGKFTTDDFDSEELQTLVIKARALKKNRWWNLT